jgi:MFS family permease
LTNLREGFVYIWTENRIILHLIIMSFILTFCFIPLPALLPAYSGEVLGAQANVGGYLMAAQGVGGVSTTFLIASLGFGIKKGKLALIALVVGSAAILTLSQSHWLLLSLAMMVCLGLCQTCFIVGNQTLVQQMVPDNLRGRVTSIYMLEHGLGPVGIFLIGLLMDIYTVRGALTLVAAISLVTAIFFLIIFRRVRQMD